MSQTPSAVSVGKRLVVLAAAAGLCAVLPPARGADGVSVSVSVPSGRSGDSGMEVKTGEPGKGAAQAEAPQKTDREIFYGLSEVIYKYPKSTEDRLRSVDRRAERLLLGNGSASEIKALRDYSHREIMLLAENYYQASKNIPMKDSARAFRTRMMCESYSDAYRALGKGDVAAARTAMKRGKEQNDELLDSFSRDR